MSKRKNIRFIRGKAIIFPSSLSDRYERYVLDNLKATKLKIKAQLINKLAGFSANIDFLRVDDSVDEIEKTVNRLKTEIDITQIALLSYLASEAYSVLRYTSRQVIRSISGLITAGAFGRNLGADAFTSFFNNDLQMLSKSWAYTNARLIKSINYNLLDEVANIIQTGFRFGDSVTTIKNALQKKFDISTKKARFLARDQISKLHSNYAINEMKKFNIIIYEWSTARDERVRESHKVLQGKICSINNPHIYKNSPSDSSWLSKKSIGGVEKQVAEDYGCRCVMIPVVKL